MLQFLKFVLLSSLTVLFSQSLHANHRQDFFAPSEHVMLGEKIHLTLADGSDNTNPYLHFPNGLKLHYAEIVALGDFYFVQGQPISFGASVMERKMRFLAVFNSLAESDDAKIEARKICDLLQLELAIIRRALEQGEPSEQAYQRIAEEFSIKYNCITGGGCTPQTWLIDQGRFLKIAKENYDHFGQEAWLAYAAGHELAIEIALAARATNNPAQLEVAYAMDAFAAHFITDRFSAGHMRTPRVQLPQQVTPSVIGSVLINYMHNEESKYGLHVHNKLGEHWIAYGDSSLSNPNDSDNQTHLVQFLAASVAQIKMAFFYGVNASLEELANRLPEPDSNETVSSGDIAPMFLWDSATQRVLRRVSTADPYDYHWTENWWGWSTLLQLEQERGLPLEERALLEQAGFKIPVSSHPANTSQHQS